MRKLTYLAILEPASDGGYGVYFPDLPGCISYGKTIEEAQSMASEAAGLHIYGIESDNDPLPEPSKTLTPEQTIGCIVTPVSIYPDIIRNEMDYKRVKTNTTIPNWLKKIAEKNHVNYSHLLETALMEYLGLTERISYK